MSWFGRVRRNKSGNVYFQLTWSSRDQIDRFPLPKKLPNFVCIYVSFSLPLSAILYGIYIEEAMVFGN